MKVLSEDTVNFILLSFAIIFNGFNLQERNLMTAEITRTAPGV